MKLKSAPEDFRVDERTLVQATDGPFALYRLSKCGIGTPEAIHEILHRWNLPRNRISYGGLKDRHAQTTQHISIHRGPRTGFSERSFSVEYLGQIPRPFAAKDIQCNRFAIRLRGIEKSRCAELDRRLEETKEAGIINYFDDQRFGSLGASGDLIGVAWCKGDYERALYLAMAEHNSHDRPREREQKEILRDYWGQWDKCKSLLDRSHHRSIITYLVDHPTDFKRAVALIRQDLRGIYLSAFQSWVWNRWLSACIVRLHGEYTCGWLPSRCGPLALPNLQEPELRARWAPWTKMQLPLPSARERHWPPDTEELLESVLAPQGMSVREMRLKFPRDTFFSKGERSVALQPTSIDSHWEDAGENSQRCHWCLRFDLPRGAYATMAIRQWTLESIEEDLEGEEEDV